MRRDTMTHFMAAGLGAVVGGLIFAVATHAIPKMMAQIMSSMMGTMMARMGAEGCNPEEM